MNKIYKKLYLYFMEKYIATRDEKHEDSLTLALTDHAVIRYLERVRGIDMQEVRGAILGENLGKRVKRLGDGKYDMHGFRVVVQKKRVKTILPPKGNNGYQSI